MKSQKIILTMALVLFRITILFCVIIGIWSLGETSYSYCYKIIAQTSMSKEPGKNVSISFAESMDNKDLSVLLEKRGVIEDANIFHLQLKVNKYEEKLEHGTYTLNTSMTPKQIMQVIAGEAEE